MRNRMKYSLIIFLLTTGCSPLETRQIIWQRVSQERLQQICQTYYQDRQHYKKGIYGCALYYKEGPNRRICYVYTLESLTMHSNQEQYVLGHETMHCFDGSFHQ
jgi:hypothetical protein